MESKIPCIVCWHKQNHHVHYESIFRSEILGTTTAIEHSCIGSGKKWFGENKCQCWIYVPSDNLSWIEHSAKEKGLV